MKGVLILMVVGLFSILTSAQNQPGQLVVNAGIGYSPGFNGQINILNSQSYPVGLSNNWDQYFNFTCSAIPNLGVTLDYGLSRRFSIGLGSSYQNETANWTLEYPPYFSDEITRINIAVRVLFHLNKSNPDNEVDFDHYIGIRPGLCYWGDNPLNNELLQGYDIKGNPYYVTRPSAFLDHPNSFVFCFQVVYGMRFYLVNNFGIHFEVGIGQPFLVEAGLTYRIHT